MHGDAGIRRGGVALMIPQSDAETRLLFAAGRIASERGMTAPRVVDFEALHEEGPTGEPVVVVGSAGSLTVEVARQVAAMVGAGRQVLVVIDTQPDPEVVQWMPPGVMATTAPVLAGAASAEALGQSSKAAAITLTLSEYAAARSGTIDRALLAREVRTVRAEGAFNVEGGFAGLASRPFGDCDEQCWINPPPDRTASVGPFAPSGMPCSCGRSTSTCVAMMAGFGDGLFPVTRWIDNSGETVGLCAWFATETTQGDLRGQVASATTVFDYPPVMDDWAPIVLGRLQCDGSLFFSDVGAGRQGYVLDCAVPAGIFTVVAWVAAEVGPLNAFGITGPRAMMAAAISDRVASRLLSDLESYDQEGPAAELRLHNADPTQVVAGNVVPLDADAAEMTDWLRSGGLTRS